MPGGRPDSVALTFFPFSPWWCTFFCCSAVSMPVEGYVCKECLLPDALSSTNWDVRPWRQVRKCAKIYRGFDVSVKELISHHQKTGVYIHSGVDSKPGWMTCHIRSMPVSIHEPVPIWPTPQLPAAHFLAAGPLSVPCGFGLSESRVVAATRSGTK